MVTEVSSRFHCAEITHCGNKRNVNEDTVLSRQDLGLWVVADGMGGHEAGDVASGMVVSALGQLQPAADFAGFVEAIEETLHQTNQHIRDHAEQHFDGKLMGSTIVSIVLEQQWGACLWAGDSRCYRLRGGILQQLSMDHSEAQELLDRGSISQADALHHPASHVITRAVGGAPTLFVDTVLFDVKPDDVFMICSDGLYNELADSEIAQLLGLDVKVAVQALLDETLQRPAKDNVSMIAVKAGAG